MRVLVVEDEADLADAIARGLRREGYAVDVAYDGDEAVDKAGVNDYDVVCLDLNLPRKDGRETLHEIKNDPILCMIPVVILTTSDAKSDVVLSYQGHANSYIKKPADMDLFIEAMKSMTDFWLSVARLPSR